MPGAFTLREATCPSCSRDFLAHLEVAYAERFCPFRRCSHAALAFRIDRHGSQHQTRPRAPPHEWRNRDYGESEEAAPRGRRRLQIAFVLLMLFMLAGMPWSGVVQPLLR